MVSAITLPALASWTTLSLAAGALVLTALDWAAMDCVPLGLAAGGVGFTGAALLGATLACCAIFPLPGSRLSGAERCVSKFVSPPFWLPACGAAANCASRFLGAAGSEVAGLCTVAGRVTDVAAL